MMNVTKVQCLVWVFIESQYDLHPYMEYVVFRIIICCVIWNVQLDLACV